MASTSDGDRRLATDLPSKSADLDDHVSFPMPFLDTVLKEFPIAVWQEERMEGNCDPGKIEGDSTLESSVGSINAHQSLKTKAAVEDAQTISVESLKESIDHKSNLFPDGDIDMMDLDSICPGLEESIMNDTSFDSDSFDDAGHEISDSSLPMDHAHFELPRTASVEFGGPQHRNQQQSQPSFCTAPQKPSPNKDGAHLNKAMEPVSMRAASNVTGLFQENLAGRSVCQKCGDLESNHKDGICQDEPGNITPRYSNKGRKPYCCDVCRKPKKRHQKPCTTPKCCLKPFHGLLKTRPALHWLNLMAQVKKKSLASPLHPHSPKSSCAIDKNDFDASASLCRTVKNKRKGAKADTGVVPASPKRGGYNCKMCKLPKARHLELLKILTSPTPNASNGIP